MLRQIYLSQHVEIDLSRIRQVSNIFCCRLFAFVGNMFPTCWKLVGNLSKTCSRLCRKRVFDKIDLMEFGHKGIAICHRRKFGQVWGSTAPLPEVVGKLCCRKAPLWTFDYHMEKSKSFCDVTPGLQAFHRKVRFTGFVLGKQAKIRKLGNFQAPQLRNHTSYRKVDRYRKLPGPWTTTWNKQYLSAV